MCYYFVVLTILVNNRLKVINFLFPFLRIPAHSDNHFWQISHGGLTEYLGYGKSLRFQIL